MSDYVFSELEIDAIGEISNICLGNSTSALSLLVHETVDITPPKVEIIEKSEYTKDVSSKKVFVRVNYTEGVQGCSILMLEEQDAKIIADLLMGGDGHGNYEETELGEMQLSAVSEAMNQMMGSSATSMSVMLGHKTDISTPNTQLMGEGQYLACEFPNDEKFVKVGFTMHIGNILSCEVVQLYPHDLGKAISDLFLLKKAKEKEQAKS